MPGWRAGAAMPDPTLLPFPFPIFDLLLQHP
jgi:hypothetical protein